MLGNEGVDSLIPHGPVESQVGLQILANAEERLESDRLCLGSFACSTALGNL